MKCYFLAILQQIMTLAGGSFESELRNFDRILELCDEHYKYLVLNNYIYKTVDICLYMLLGDYSKRSYGI